ncbi:unnamed protein product [Acanthoscelides obtectus]|nr:unnamed protein product [Acanthoscelides obtectus]CAK1658912.1 hypothetical protein AOBTE_LOCUS21197 [Acanthoscelides obtectus]
MVFVCVFLVHAVFAAPPSILQGPSTKTIVVGPDGSKIEAFAPGGQINLEGHGPLIQETPKVVLYESKPEVTPQIVDGSEVDGSEVAVPQAAAKEEIFPKIWPGGIEVRVIPDEPKIVRVPTVGAIENFDYVVTN